MPFQIPETLDGLAVDALPELDEQASAEFDRIREDPDLDATGLARLRELAAFVVQVRGRMAELDETARELDELAAQVHADPAVQATADEPAHDTTAEPVGPDPAVPVVITAADRAGPAPSVVRAARHAPRPVAPARSARIRAAADVPNVPNGHLFADLDEVAATFDRRFEGFPRRVSQRTHIRQGVAVIDLPAEQGLVADGRNDPDVLELAGSEGRLSGGNLLAAGGWCAPSDTLFDLCPGLESTDGMLDLPTITVARGGLRYPRGLDFHDLYTAIGFVQTEADSIAGRPKPFYTVPCPQWDEARLEADGIHIRHDIVQDAVWPELTRDIIRRGTVAHQHKINARVLAQLVTGSTPVTLPLGADISGDATTTGVLGAIGLAATDYRTRYRMRRDATVEAILPQWMLEWVRADVARRSGVDLFAVSDAQISDWFRQRKVAPQFVYDWQDGFVDPAGVGLGGATPPGRWPTQVRLLMYAAGTWVKGTRSVISLDAVYDSTGLANNEFTAVFTEEATLTVRRCNASYVYTVPLCPTGQTATPAAFTCTAPAPSAA